MRYPELERLTATVGINTPRVQGTTTNWGVTFTGTGAEISNDSGAKGTLTADRADVTGVNTEWVQGRGAGDGKITFPKDGLNVSQGTGAWGTVHADKADVNSVITKEVHEPAGGRNYIRFEPSIGVHIFGGVTTGWVRGQGDGEGSIRFSPDGLEVRRKAPGGHALGDVHCASVNGHSA
ncbi:hypothetical protein AB0395_28725 [Streptosporangium sp. NPDC051023]|uniref:hypothetical protein n=1 Tax=Streptosporangium sp. NPDC051023 TaxID=3155410 RepID=UPI00344E4DAD